MSFTSGSGTTQNGKRASYCMMGHRMQMASLMSDMHSTKLVKPLCHQRRHRYIDARGMALIVFLVLVAVWICSVTTLLQYLLFHKVFHVSLMPLILAMQAVLVFGS